MSTTPSGSGTTSAVAGEGAAKVGKAPTSCSTAATREYAFRALPGVEAEETKVPYRWAAEAGVVQDTNAGSHLEEKKQP